MMMRVMMMMTWGAHEVRVQTEQNYSTASYRQVAAKKATTTNPVPES